MSRRQARRPGAALMPEDLGGPKGFRTAAPVLQADKVRCVGDRVAFVVAETGAGARRRRTGRGRLRAATGARRSRAGASSRARRRCGTQCPNGNVGVTLAFGDKDATDAAFANARSMSPRSIEQQPRHRESDRAAHALGHYRPATAKFTLYSTSQDPHGVRPQWPVGVPHIPETEITCHFAGCRRRLRHEGRYLSRRRAGAWASRRCGRPVKWTATRSESLCSTITQGRDQLVTPSIALDAQRQNFWRSASSAYQALGSPIGAARRPRRCSGR